MEAAGSSAPRRAGLRIRQNQKAWSYLRALNSADLCAGNTVVLTFFGFLHPKFVRAVGYYKLNMIFTSGFMLDKWLENEDDEHMDFSSLNVFSCGGSYVPREKMKQYKAFAQRHGYRGPIVRGYGMSECGAVQILAPDTLDSDVLGFAFLYVLRQTLHAFRGVEFSVNFAKAPLLFQCNDVKCEANRKCCQSLAAGGGHEQAYPEAPQRKAL